MPPIGVIAVYAVGGDLQRHTVFEHRQRPVLQTGRNGSILCKNRCRLLGKSRGGDIPIVRLLAAKQIANATADRIRFKAGIIQLCDGLPYLVGYPQNLTSLVKYIAFSAKNLHQPYHQRYRADRKRR